MFVLTVILSVLTAAAFIPSGVGKLTGATQMVEGLTNIGVSPSLRNTIGVLELLGSAAVIIGLWVEWLGILAAIGLLLLMAGALIYHARARDEAKNFVPPASLLVLTLVLLIVRSVSA